MFTKKINHHDIVDVEIVCVGGDERVDSEKHRHRTYVRTRDVVS